MTKSYGAPYLVGQNSLDARDAIIAGAVSHSHVVLIGNQGCGKTAIAKRLMEQITDNNYVAIAIDPSTPTSRITGNLDMPKYVNEGVEVINTINSAFDLSKKGVMLDEFGRGSNPVYDAILNATLRMDVPNQDDAPWFVCTANILPNQERHFAMQDRFPIYYHYRPENLDVVSVAVANSTGIKSGLNVPGLIPEWSDVQSIYAIDFPTESITASAEYCDMLSNAALQGIEINGQSHTWKPNYRRIAQWQKILLRVSAYYYGQASFTQVHKMAATVLQYAMPCITLDESTYWRSLAGMFADTIGNAVQAAFDKAQAELKTLYEQQVKGSLTVMQVVERAGRILTDQQANLLALGNDDRVTEAIQDLSYCFSAVCNGKDPEKALGERRG